MTTLPFSLIIPARNEAAYLPRLLDSVDEARTLYPRGAGAVEVVVADNASTDNTAEQARDRGCRVVREEKRIIAAVRNAGARAAKGEWIVFVDADSRIHPQTFNVVEKALLTGKYVGGASGVRLERMSPGIAAACMVMYPMVWVTGFDTGAVFCSRKDFDLVGGYKEERLYAEDVQFLWDLRRLGKATGRRLTRLRSIKAVASTRKFDRFGDWHYLGLIGRFFAGQMFSKDAMRKYARTYWYDR